MNKMNENENENEFPRKNGVLYLHIGVVYIIGVTGPKT